MDILLTACNATLDPAHLASAAIYLMHCDPASVVGFVCRLCESLTAQFGETEVLAHMRASDPHDLLSWNFLLSACSSSGIRHGMKVEGWRKFFPTCWLIKLGLKSATLHIRSDVNDGPTEAACKEWLLLAFCLTGETCDKLHTNGSRRLHGHPTYSPLRSVSLISEDLGQHVWDTIDQSVEYSDVADMRVLLAAFAHAHRAVWRLRPRCMYPHEDGSSHATDSALEDYLASVSRCLKISRVALSRTTHIVDLAQHYAIRKHIRALLSDLHKYLSWHLADDGHRDRPEVPWSGSFHGPAAEELVKDIKTLTSSVWEVLVPPDLLESLRLSVMEAKLCALQLSLESMLDVLGSRHRGLPHQLADVVSCFAALRATSVSGASASP
ncbi:hypothetical protein BV20DRAFT_1057265 [Pilatotrama ljubarskyi]|nr:hypothetical protein BV20DRAFT_1057265 [Pilatotrama ljubarskyi]